VLAGGLSHRTFLSRRGTGEVGHPHRSNRPQISRFRGTDMDEKLPGLVANFSLGAPAAIVPGVGGQSSPRLGGSHRANRETHPCPTESVPGRTTRLDTRSEGPRETADVDTPRSVRRARFVASTRKEMAHVIRALHTTCEPDRPTRLAPIVNKVICGESPPYASFVRRAWLLRPAAENPLFPRRKLQHDLGSVRTSLANCFARKPNDHRAQVTTLHDLATGKVCVNPVEFGWIKNVVHELVDSYSM
jgi:hypothetical protein